MDERKMDGRRLDQAGGGRRTRRPGQRRQLLVSALASVVVFCTTYALILPAITMERPSDVPAAAAPDEPAAQSPAEPAETASAEPGTDNDSGPGADSERAPKEPAPGEASGEAAGPAVPDISEMPDASVPAAPDTETGDPAVSQLPEPRPGDTDAKTGGPGANSSPGSDSKSDANSGTDAGSGSNADSGPGSAAPGATTPVDPFEPTGPVNPPGPSVDANPSGPAVPSDPSDPSDADLSGLSADAGLADPSDPSASAGPSEPVPAGDATADVETASDWARTVAGIRLTGIWAEDLLAVAQSQLGYAESSRNFVVGADGRRRGYTRYGAWYGDAYGDWCAMFISFCLNYAEINRAVMPYDGNCQNWIRSLSQLDLYRARRAAGASDESDAAEPSPGDLIFFDQDADGIADHVGIVAGRTADAGVSAQIHVIEGNSADRVQTVDYAVSDRTILGYGRLPQNPALAAQAEPEPTDQTPVQLTAKTADGVTLTLTAPASALPAPADALSLYAASVTDDSLVALVENTFEDEPSVRRKTRLFDIRLMKGDEAVQPLGPVSVSLTGIPDEKEDAAVFHVDPDRQAAEPVKTETDADGSVTMDTDHFSIYGVTYTVDFHYGDYHFSIAGESAIYLSDLFVRLGIERRAADVVSAVFSDPNLIHVQQQDKDGVPDWLLTSLAPFSTRETLTVTFENGDVLVIGVTDVITAGSVGDFMHYMPLGTARVAGWNCHMGNAIYVNTWGICVRSGNTFYLAGSWKNDLGNNRKRVWPVSGGFTVVFQNGIQYHDGSMGPLTMTVQATRVGVGTNIQANNITIFDYNALAAKSNTSVAADMTVTLSGNVGGQSACLGIVGIDKAGIVTQLNPWNPSASTWDFHEQVTFNSGLNTQMYRPASSGLEILDTFSVRSRGPGDQNNYNYGFSTLMASGGSSFYYAGHDTYAYPFQTFHALGLLSQYQPYNSTGWVNGAAGGHISIDDYGSGNHFYNTANAWRYYYSGSGKTIRIGSHPSEGYYLHSAPGQTYVDGDKYLVGQYKAITGSVIIRKYDENGAPLQGAGFTVSGTSAVHGAFSLTGTTNEQGICRIDNIPYGGPYTVEETVVPSGYMQAPAQTVQIQTRDEVVQLTFVNTLAVDVVKTASVDGAAPAPGTAADPNAVSVGSRVQYRIHVPALSAAAQYTSGTVSDRIPAHMTLDTTPGTFTPGMTWSTDGSGQTTVRWTALDLSVGAMDFEFTVTVDPLAAGQTTRDFINQADLILHSANPDKTIQSNQTYHRAEQQTASLTVRKTVLDGASGSFPFEVTIVDANGQPVILPPDPTNPPAYTVDPATGLIRFELAHQGQVTLPGIPLNAVATVREARHDGYTVLVKEGPATLSTGDACTLTIQADRTVEFVNNPGVVLPNAGGPGTHIHAAGGLLLMLSVLVIYGARRRTERGRVRRRSR